MGPPCFASPWQLSGACHWDWTIAPSTASVPEKAVTSGCCLTANRSFFGRIELGDRWADSLQQVYSGLYPKAAKAQGLHSWHGSAGTSFAVCVVVLSDGHDQPSHQTKVPARFRRCSEVGKRRHG